MRATDHNFVLRSWKLIVHTMDTRQWQWNNTTEWHAPVVGSKCSGYFQLLISCNDIIIIAHSAFLESCSISLHSVQSPTNSCHSRIILNNAVQLTEAFCTQDEDKLTVKTNEVSTKKQKTTPFHYFCSAEQNHLG